MGLKKPLLESSWRRLGGSLSRLGGSWRALGASWARWGHSWRRLERFKTHVGGSLARLGAVLGALEAMLEPSGGEKASQMEPKRVPNRAPEATRDEYGETLFFNDGTQDFNDFQISDHHF